jgi:thiamine biosynthesis lipoprotein ApbE
MGTTFEVTVYRPRSERSQTTADLEAAHAEVVRIDHLMSLYRADSELMSLNGRAGEGPVPISELTFEVLEAAAHYASLSDGAIDITVQPLVDLWGFYRIEQASIPPLDKIEAVLQGVGMDRMSLVSSGRTAALESGTALDLGSIAKGYAVDRALAVLRTRGVPSALVDLGGNIGVLGQAPGGRPWIVGIRHPRREGLIGEVRFRIGAVATSGDYDRYFEVDGKRYSHLLDPRTGRPVEGVYSLTVVAPNATAADALSTAAFVLGPERGMALLAHCEGVEGLLVEPSGRPEDLAVRMTPDSTLGGEVAFVLDLEPSGTIRPRQEPADNSPAPDCLFPLK